MDISSQSLDANVSCGRSRKTLNTEISVRCTRQGGAKSHKWGGGDIKAKVGTHLVNCKLIGTRMIHLFHNSPHSHPNVFYQRSTDTFTIQAFKYERKYDKEQWLWLIRQSGRFQFQRSAVRIQSLANILLNIYCQLYSKDENKEKESGNGPFLIRILSIDKKILSQKILFKDETEGL